MDVSLRERGFFVFGSFRLDPVRRTLRRDDREVALTARLFDTLVYLVQNPERLVTRDELESAVWGGRVVEEGNLQKAISALRKALQAEAGADSLIITVPGRGFRFATPVMFAPEAVGTEIVTDKHEHSSAESAPVPHFAPRKLLSIAALAAAMAALALAFLVKGTDRAATRTGGGKVVLAPLDNLTTDPDIDLALDRAAEVDLAQSPYLAMLSSAQVQATLKLMTLAPDTRLSPSLALEVCARNEGRAVVAGSIAHIGQHLMVTLTATSCGDGAIIAADKGEADQPEALLPVLDRMVAGLRAHLGESDTSLRRYDVPVLAERTSSFDALRAMSKAAADFEHGRLADSIPLLLHATELDPQFAAAWSRLGNAYLVQNDLPRAAAAIRKAYAMRGTLSEPERFYATTNYDRIALKDYHAAIRDLKTWSESYPLNPLPVNQISNIEMFMGDFPAALAYGQRALALGLRTATGFVSVAHAQMALGDYDGAERTAHEAEQAGVLGEEMRGILMQIAYVRNDNATLAAQIEASRGTSAELPNLKFRALMAYAEGHVRVAEGLFGRRTVLARQFGVTDDLLAARAAYLFNFSMIDQARTALGQLGVKTDPRDYLLDTAEFGDSERAETTIAADLADAPSDTMLNEYYAPIDRAALALRAGRPADAVADLRPAMPYQWRDFTAPYLLGTAYLRIPDGASAVRQFRAMLDHRGIFPASPFYTLAHLGLARACRITGDLPCSRKEYASFLEIMRSADEDIPVLQQARSEYTAVGAR